MPRRETEHAPSDRRPDSVVEDVFLSPRVVDADAFARYAGQLRSLVEQSAAAGDELKVAANRAHEVFDALAREWGDRGSRTARVGEAMEAIERIETRLRDAGDVLDALRERRDAQRTVEAMRLACAAQVEQVEARLASRVENVLATLQQRAAALEVHESRIRTVEAESAERLRTLASECERRVDAALARLGEAHANADGAVEKLRSGSDEAVRDAGRALRETLDAATEDSRRVIAAALADVESRVAEVRREAGDSARAAAETALRQAEVLGAAKHAEAEQRAESLMRRLDSFLRRAETIVGANAAGGRLPGSLGDLVEKGEKMRVAVATSTQELAALRAQTDVARTELNRLDKRVTEAVENAERRLEQLNQIGVDSANTNDVAPAAARATPDVEAPTNAASPSNAAPQPNGASPGGAAASARDVGGRFVAAPD